MDITRSKVFGLVVALSYVATAIAMAGWDANGVGVMCVFLSLPMALIWFPDEIAQRTRTDANSGSRFNSETPASMVTITGWLFLVGFLPLLAYLLNPQDTNWMVVAATFSVSLLLIFGIVYISSFAVSGISKLRQNNWRFTTRDLLVVFTIVALALGGIMLAARH